MGGFMKQFSCAMGHLNSVLKNLPILFTQQKELLKFTEGVASVLPVERPPATPAAVSMGEVPYSLVTMTSADTVQYCHFSGA